MQEVLFMQGHNHNFGVLFSLIITTGIAGAAAGGAVTGGGGGCDNFKPFQCFYCFVFMKVGSKLW